MHSDITNIFDKDILRTKQKPFYFYLTVSLLTIILVAFFLVITVKDMDKDSTTATALIFIFLAIYVYVTFGRYLASITLFDHEIQVNYIFPWNKRIEFRFTKLTEIEFKEFELVDRLSYSWYRGGKWLYLKNEFGEVCQFKYTINPNENEKLLEELQKRCCSNVVCS